MGPCVTSARSALSARSRARAQTRMSGNSADLSRRNNDWKPLGERRATTSTNCIRESPSAGRLIGFYFNSADPSSESDAIAGSLTLNTLFRGEANAQQIHFIKDCTLTSFWKFRKFPHRSSLYGSAVRCQAIMVSQRR